MKHLSHEDINHEQLSKLCVYENNKPGLINIRGDVHSTCSINITKLKIIMSGV